jgi:hypothetical protein
LNKVNKSLVEEFELRNFEATVIESPIVTETREKRKLSSASPIHARHKRKTTYREIYIASDDGSYSDNGEDSDDDFDNDLSHFIVNDSEEEEISISSGTRSGRAVQKPTTFGAEFYSVAIQPKKKYVQAIICNIPPYSNSEFVDHHSTHCYKCKRSGSPVGPEQVKLGPEEKRTRLLLCNTCSLSIHNNCAALTTTINKETGFLKCKKCVISLDCTGCNKKIMKSDIIPFRCRDCFRIFHSKCIASSVSPELADLTKTVNIDDLYKTGVCLECMAYPPKVTEKVAAERTINGQLEYLIKWKGLSYRHTNWVSAKWIAHTNPALYRGYLKRKEKLGTPQFSEDWKIVDRILDVEWTNKSAGQVRRILAVFKDTEYAEGNYSIWSLS